VHEVKMSRSTIPSRKDGIVAGLFRGKEGCAVQGSNL
jgi:hypothetical protein